ncbi:MAG: ribosome small subunit-dependent GTPase A [Gemmatimonadales bacterium]
MPKRGTVMARSGSTYRVATPMGEVTAVLRGKVKRDDRDRIVVGDVVTLDRVDSHGVAGITGAEPRRNVLERRSPTGRAARPVAANLDRVLVLTAVTQPKPNPGLIDRLLVIAEANDIPAGVVITKIDLATHADLGVRFRNAGYPVWPVSIRTGEGVDDLAAEIRGHTTLLTGPSGVGKSSLLNRIQPGLALPTGEISAKIQRGKNTTVSAVMVPLEAGGFLVDTPGFSDVGLAGVEPRGLANCFPEMRRFVANCKFPDCHHVTEPGCAVRAAVDAGEIADDRYQTYRSLLTELGAAPRAWE